MPEQSQTRSSHTSEDVPFSDVLQRLMPEDGVVDDATLADIIDTDGRQRLHAGLKFSLDRYLSHLSDPASFPIAIDAAIEMTRRSLEADGLSSQQAYASLQAQYPNLEECIVIAAELDAQVWSTTSIVPHVRLGHRHTRAVPGDFGPTLPNGERRYELLELLGAGATGQVYRAHDRQLSDAGHDALVSIKIIPSTDESDARARDRLLDEATKARRIRHPNVVSVLDRGTASDEEEGEADYIIYEFVEGGDLKQWIDQRDGQLAVKDAAWLIARAAEGTHAAHMAGLVHCDLKPDNIVLTDDGEPKIADFGVARRYATTEQGDAQPQLRIGSRMFVSPEQYRMEPGSLTIPTDIYALGGILYWLITGEYPNGTSFTHVAEQFSSESGRSDPPCIRDVIPSVDRDLDRICARAMAYDPAARHGSAAALADDLQRWLKHEPIDWLHTPLWRRGVMWWRRKPALAASIAVASILLLGTLFIAGYFARDAAASARELAIEEQLREQYDELLAEFLSVLDAYDELGQYDRLFANVWITRWLYEPNAFVDPRDARLGIDQLHIDSIEKRAQQMRDAHGPRAISTILWETALAFWYIKEARWAEAAALVEEVLRNVDGLGNEPDPLQKHLLALHAVSWLGMFDPQASGTLEFSGESPQRTLHIIQQRLLSGEAELARTDSGTGMHRLILESLVQVHDPDHLNDTDAHAMYQAKLDSELSDG